MIPIGRFGRRGVAIGAAAGFVASLWFAPAAAASFVEFESGQVRPLALSPDGLTLFAVNTPDNRLEIFGVAPGGLTHTGAVPVGMEPVAVAVRPDGTQVWVVNHLSDSVSVVDLTQSPPRVVRTLLVGDEPRDIVFAGPGGNRAFITTAHRGQNTALQPTIDTELRAEGIGRADVWVFDATDLGTSDPLRRYAARACDRRRHRLRGRVPVRQPDHHGRRTRRVRRRRRGTAVQLGRRHHAERASRGGRCPAGCRRRTRTSRAPLGRRWG